MNILKEELEYRIGVLRSLGNTITLNQLNELDILEEYLATVIEVKEKYISKEKVEKEIDESDETLGITLQGEKWLNSIKLKERIFND